MPFDKLRNFRLLPLCRNRIGSSFQCLLFRIPFFVFILRAFQSECFHIVPADRSVCQAFPSRFRHLLKRKTEFRLQRNSVLWANFLFFMPLLKRFTSFHNIAFKTFFSTLFERSVSRYPGIDYFSFIILSKQGSASAISPKYTCAASRQPPSHFTPRYSQFLHISGI